MKKIILFISFIFVYSQTSAYQEYIEKTIDNKKVSVIKVILDWKHTLKIASTKSWDSISWLVNSVWWLSWVNWWYFCPADYANCNWENRSDMTKISNFETINTSNIWLNYNQSWLFGIDEFWNLKLIPYFDTTDLNTIRYGIWNYPILLHKWYNKIDLNYLDKKMNTSWIKSFICSSDDKTLYMWNISNIKVYEMPDFLKTNFDCKNAINLDSWWSLSMVYNKKVIKKNWRPILDAFVVVETKTKSFDKTKYNNILNKVYKNIDKLDNEKLKQFENMFKMKMKNYETESLKYYILNEVATYITKKLWQDI